MSFQLKSLTGRMFIGQVIGFITGVVFILLMPTFGFPLFSTFGGGALLMFVLMGMFIGLMGIFDRHPVLDFKMKWYIRGAIAGFLFMFMLVLLSYESLEVIMQSTLISWTGLTSPYWAVLDGIIIGLVMAYLETKFAGEGSELPLK